MRQTARRGAPKQRNAQKSDPMETSRADFAIIGEEANGKYYGGVACMARLAAVGRTAAGCEGQCEVPMMERKRASDFDPEVLRLFDQYVHGLIDRRAFLERAARFAVGGVTASMLLDALNPRFAEAQQIATND